MQREPGASVRKSVLLLPLVALVACTAPPAIPPEVVPPPPVQAGPSAEEIRQRAISHFLARAEHAQREGFLTMPAGGSAYDFYLNVQQLDPGNRRAASGIQTIVLELVSQAREALRQRSFGRVNSLLNTADELMPNNPLSAEVRAQLVRERSRATVDEPAAQAVSLPAAELAARSEGTKSLLHSLALRIREHELRVIIIARNDAEGRWIYSQLREAVPGYRVRGDIKLGSPPRLLLQKSN